MKKYTFKIFTLVIFLLLVTLLTYLLRWSEYKNENFNFKIDYPGTNRPDAQSNGVKFSSLIAGSEFRINYYKFNPNDDLSCVNDGPFYSCESTYFTDKNTRVFGYESNNKTEILVNGLKAFKYTTNCNSAQIGRMPCVPTILIVINKDDRQYLIEFDNVKNLNKKRLKILNSFRILN